MFIAAIAHKYSFPHEPYHINIPDYGNDRTWFSALAAMWDVRDVQQDVTEHLGVVGSSFVRRLRGRSSYHLTRGTSETDHLMSNNINTLSSSQSLYQGNGQNYNITSASDSDVSTASTTKNHYGAVAGNVDHLTMAKANDMTQIHGKNDGINIIKQSQKAKDYSPQYGVPQIVGNYFTQQQHPLTHQQPLSSASSSMRYERSSRSDNTTSKSEMGFDERSDGAAGIDNNMKKSDSAASDWLSTPNDEFMGIDVKGIEKDRITFKGDPKI